MSLRNRVVDAGDEVKVDGEWRMPPKVDIVGGSSLQQGRRYGTNQGHFGRRGPPVLSEATFDLHRRQSSNWPGNTLRYLPCAAPFKSPLVLF